MQSIGYQLVLLNDDQNENLKYCNVGFFLSSSICLAQTN